MCDLGMCHSLLLASALLLTCTQSGESTASAPVKVRVLAGSSAVLPCEFNAAATRHGFPTTVEWSVDPHRGPKFGIVYLYRDGREDRHVLKNAAFEGRTSFAENGGAAPRNGNVSLRIAAVRPTDAGTYLCKKMWNQDYGEDTTVVLEVAVVSEPRLSAASAAGSVVTVQCEVDHCLHQPSILFLDDGGNQIPAEKEAKRRESAVAGCYTTTGRVAVLNVTSSVTCRVQDPVFNESTDVKLYFLADSPVSSHPILWIVAIVGWILFVGLAFAVSILLWKRFCKSGGELKHTVTRQSSSASIDNGTSETQSLLEQKKHMVDQLTEENAKLRSDLHTANSQLERRDGPPVANQLNQPTISPSTPSNVKRPPLQRQSSNPGSSRPIQTTHHRNTSAPDLPSVSAAAAAAPSSKARRSMSDSFRRDPNAPRPPRRQSFGAHASVLTSNRFSPLNEESDG